MRGGRRKRTHTLQQGMLQRTDCFTQRAHVPAQSTHACVHQSIKHACIQLVHPAAPVDVWQAALRLADGEAAQRQRRAGHGQPVHLREVDGIHQPSSLQQEREAARGGGGQCVQDAAVDGSSSSTVRSLPRGDTCTPAAL